MGSKRFPGKMLAKLGGYPLIEWVFYRLKKASRIDGILLATSDDKKNDALEEIAKKYSIATMRGDENNVLSRFGHAVNGRNFDCIVRICADNPFIDPVEVDRLIKFFKKTKCDYSFNHQDRGISGYADGFGAEIFSSKTLDVISKNAITPEQKEHVTLYIWENTHMFNIQPLEAPKMLAFPQLRFDVDTHQDLKFLNGICITKINNNEYRYTCCN